MNLLAFPFYSSLREQSRFSGCGQLVRALPAPKSEFLPFVLQLPATGQGLDCLRVYEANGDTLFTTVSSGSFTYEVFTDGTTDFLFYYGGLVAGLNLPCNDYYLEVQGYYSEVFSVVRNINNYLRLEWKGNGALFQSGFYNLLYLDTLLAEPAYVIDEEGEEDANGAFVALSTKVEKTLKLETLLLPEFLVDALAGMALHEEKQIGRYRDVSSLKLTPTWNRQGCAASVALSFVSGPAHTSQGCGSAAPLLAVDLTGFVPSACDGTAIVWTDTGRTRCQKINAVNTGWLEKEQTSSISTVRWLRTIRDEISCPLPALLLRSRAITDNVYRTNCGADETAGFVEYTVPEGQVTGYDQAAIDAEALAYFEATKEAYANTNATCTPARRVSVTWRKQLKTVAVTLSRSDSVGDATVTVFAQVEVATTDRGDNLVTNAGIDVLIPAGQNVVGPVLIGFGGDAVQVVQLVEITAVTPNDYSY